MQNINNQELEDYSGFWLMNDYVKKLFSVNGTIVKKSGQENKLIDPFTLKSGGNYVTKRY